MSISSEITRLQTAKNTLKTKINTKNDSEHQITNETLDEFGDFVDSIPTGGGNTWQVPNGLKFTGSATQLPTLDLTNVTGTEGLANMFYQCSSLTSVSIINIPSSITSMYECFDQCSALIAIPEIDTSNIKNMSEMCYNCQSLVTVPILDTSKLVGTGFSRAFSFCSNLSNTSLNNILRMCINAVNLSSNQKKLSVVGLTSAQATTCQTLSNWDDFVAAGWITGF